jgi:Tfp pilus assembly protein PilN
MEGCMKTSINLLPASYQRQLMVRRRAYQWGIVLALGLMAAAVVRMSDLREYSMLSQRLDLLTREHQPTQQMLRQLVAMRDELSELHQLEQVAKELEYQRPALFLLGLLSEIGERTGGRLRVTKLELTGLQHPSSARKSDGVGVGGSGVLLTGVSLDNQSVAKLESGLWESGFFSKVELVKSTVIGDEAGSLREYQLRCEL